MTPAAGVRLGRLRPAAVNRGALALVAVAFALFGIAKTTGSGWLVVLLTLVGTVVALSAVLPALGLRKVEVRLDPPRDAMVDRPLDVSLDVAAAAPLLVRLSPLDRAWTGVLPPAQGRVTVTPKQRGVLEEVQVEVRSAAPLGLVWWSRRARYPLPRPIEVAPRPADVRLPQWAGGADASDDGRLLAQGLGDAVRSVRSYAPGDPIKLVHWPATARAGELVVKELEAEAAPALRVVVDLHGPVEAAERAASRAAGLVLAALAEGVPVVLDTAEREGPVSRRVRTRVEAGRRLARAVAGPLPDRLGAPGVVVVVAAQEGRS